jgi:S1-C subfamily serine protease
VTIAARHVAARRGVREGLLIVDVITNGSAEKAALQPTTVDRKGNVSLGDVLLTVNGLPLQQQDDLFRALDGKEIGSQVKLGINRQGHKRVIDLTLQGIKN